MSGEQPAAEVFVARYSRGWLSLQILGCLAFLAIGVALTDMIGGIDWEREPTDFTRAIGWLSVGFSAYYAVVHIRSFVRVGVAFRIDEYGIYDAKGYPGTVPWEAIRDISAYQQSVRRGFFTFKTPKVLAYDVDPEFEAPLGLWRRLGQNLNFGYTRHSNRLDHFGSAVSFEEALRAIKRFAPPHLTRELQLVGSN